VGTTEEILQYVLRVIRTYGTGSILAELLLIGGAVWLVMRFLRGTRGARLLTGLVLLLLFTHLAVQWVAARWSLARVQFLYEKFLLLLTFGSIIVFQPELRRALSKLGEAGAFRRGRRDYAELADELLDAVRSFSKNRIGAIIAVERGTGLTPFVETGVPLDAKVTSGLLRSIFWPGSALHDLGVVISNGRLAAARCLFPLSETGAGDGSLGSRHRAALGLSEDTDALIIVVSEETGRVSLAERGRLTVIPDLERFRPELLARLGNRRMLDALDFAPPPPELETPPAPAAPPKTKATRALAPVTASSSPAGGSPVAGSSAPGTGTTTSKSAVSTSMSTSAAPAVPVAPAPAGDALSP
jgi:diadenylate cyclase